MKCNARLEVEDPIPVSSARDRKPEPVLENVGKAETVQESRKKDRGPGKTKRVSV